MNSSDGRKFEYGTPEQKQGFANVHLHWTEHTASAKKIADQNKPQPQPKVSFSVPVDKLPPPEAAAAVTAGGIPAQPADFGMEKKLNLNADIAKKAIPDKLYTSALHRQPDEPK
jgi:hypothetical protein